jgi:hypothetical protein
MKEPLVVGRLSSIPRNLLLIIYTAPEELSEEDQQLKSELDMLVERLTVCLCVTGSRPMDANNI